MHPRPTKNETPTLVPDLNRGMTVGTDRVDVNAQPGKHWEKSWDKSRPHESQWERSWNQPSSFGNSRGKSSWNSMKTPRENDKITLEQPAQGQADPADQISHREQYSFTSLSENSKHHNLRWTRNST